MMNRWRVDWAAAQARLAFPREEKRCKSARITSHVFFLLSLLFAFSWPLISTFGEAPFLRRGRRRDIGRMVCGLSSENERGALGGRGRDGKECTKRRKTNWTLRIFPFPPVRARESRWQGPGGLTAKQSLTGQHGEASTEPKERKGARGRGGSERNARH